MTENNSRQRQAAEMAFGKTQSPRTARDRAFDEIDAIKLAGEEKTARLRKARLSRQAYDEAEAASKPAKKPPRKR